MTVPVITCPLISFPAAPAVSPFTPACQESALLTAHTCTKCGEEAILHQETVVYSRRSSPPRCPLTREFVPFLS